MTRTVSTAYFSSESLRGLPGHALRSFAELWLDRERSWSDLDEVERLAKQAASGPARTPESVVDLAEEALGLYQGPFLPDDDVLGWKLKGRQRARTAVSRLVALAAERLRSAGRDAASSELLARALRADPDLATARRLALIAG